MSSFVEQMLALYKSHSCLADESKVMQASQTLCVARTRNYILFLIHKHFINYCGQSRMYHNNYSIIIQKQWSALFFAAEQGNIEIIQMLLNFGANVDLRNKVSHYDI